MQIKKYFRPFFAHFILFYWTSICAGAVAFAAFISPLSVNVCQRNATEKFHGGGGGGGGNNNHKNKKMKKRKRKSGGLEEKDYDWNLKF